MRGQMLTVAAVAATLVVSSAAKKPNIVVIVADDVGLGDISYYRGRHTKDLKVRTPSIDDLAKEGMAFTAAHSPAALCAPSRYSIMVGRNTYRSSHPWGVYGTYEESPFKKSDLTLGQLMKQCGYQTGFFGKLHAGGDYPRKDNPNVVYKGTRARVELDVDITRIMGGTPYYYGFDYSFLLPAGIQRPPYAVYENAKWHPIAHDSKIIEITRAAMLKKGVTLDKIGGLGDSNWHPEKIGPLLVKKGVEFIKRNVKAGRPFFMHYNTEAAHIPHNPPNYLGKRKVKGTTKTYHLDMIVELDAQVGALVQALKDTKVYKNTLIIFTCDNGGLTRSSKIGHKTSDVYSGSKNLITEGGHRVPFIATWPGMIRAGSTSDKLIAGQDIFATIAAVNRFNIPNNQAHDSFNFLPILLEEKNAKGRDHIMQQGGTDNKVALIQGVWKLVIQTNAGNDVKSVRKAVGLYNLATDRREQKNLKNHKDHKWRVPVMLATWNKNRDSRPRTTVLPRFSNNSPPPAPGPAPVKPPTSSVDEAISFEASPTSFVEGTANFVFEVKYTAKGNREISCDVRNPNGDLLGYTVMKVQAGENVVVDVAVNTKTAPAAGGNYRVRTHLRPVGTTWDKQVAKIPETVFDIVVKAPVVTEAISFAEVPTSFAKGTTDFVFELKYTAKDNREISSDVWDSNGNVLGYTVVKVPAGSGFMDVTVKVNPAPMAGSYEVRTHLRPVGTTWDKQVAKVQPINFQVVEPKMNEVVSFAKAPTYFPHGTKNFLFEVMYSTDEERDISLEIRDPAKKYIGGALKKVQPGKNAVVTVAVNFKVAPAVGQDYLVWTHIRPTGTTWDKQLAKIPETRFDIRAMADSLAFAVTPVSFAAGTKRLAFQFRYTAVAEREVAIEIRSPANKWLGNGVAKVAPGSGTVQVDVTLISYPLIGKGYLVKSHMRPVGTTWRKATAQNGNARFGIRYVRRS